MGYFFLALLFIVLVLAYIGFTIAYRTAHNKKKPDYEVLNYDFPWHEPDYNQQIKNWIQKLELNYVKIKSPYYYKLNALVIKNNDGNKWFVILHGVTSNHKAMLDMAYMYSNLGYNVILWDSRNHGVSEGKNITYGYYERHDLKALVDYLRREYGQKIKIGIQGNSMGSSILLSYASGVRDDCDAYIADCPYSNFKKQVFDVSKRAMKMPDFIMNIVMFSAQIMIRMLYKFDIGKIDIESRIHRVENPVLFITCKNDDYINPAMTEELYEKCGSEKKKLVLFDEGKHGGAFSKNRNEYIDTVAGFLEEIDF